MDLVIDCWKNWNKFEGRASRKEYWLFLLSYILVMFFQVFLINMDHSMQLQAILTKKSKQAQLQIEDLSKPKTVWQKLRTIFGDW